jgi:hypothetical protein
VSSPERLSIGATLGGSASRLRDVLSFVFGLVRFSGCGSAEGECPDGDR